MKKIIIPLATGLTIAAAAVTPLLASCANKKVNVILKDSQHVSIDVTEVEKDKDLKITFNAEQGYLLGYIESVTIGDKEYFFWDFFYYRYEDKTKGELYIPKEYVTENISVKVHVYQAVNVYDIEYDQQTKLGTLKGFTDAFKALSKEDQADLLGYTITIPANVSSIANGAFYGETNGENASLLPESVLVLDFEQFSNCATIGADAFREASFTSINLPVSMETIGENAFFNCKSLSEIEFPYGLISIGNNSFKGCTNLWKIELPATLANIKEYAFAECKGLKRILLDRVIDEWPSTFSTTAFNNVVGDENCKLITKTHWSATAASLAWPNLANWKHEVDDEYARIVFDITTEDGKNVLNGFSQNFLNLSTVEGGDLLQKMIVGHQHCITIPSWVDEIAQNAFYKAENAGSTFPSWITDVDFDSEITKTTDFGVEIDGCVSIGKNAFYHCTGLKNVYLINTIQTIGEQAFAYCTNINTIDVNEIGGTIPENWSADAFKDSGATEGKIIVENDAAKTPWQKYFADAGFEFGEGKWKVDVKQ